MAEEKTVKKKAEIEPIVEPTIKPLNAFQRLIKVRKEMIESGMKKSGLHKQMNFTYLELEDIVPVATPIFDKYGLIPLTNIDKEMAYMTVVNVDDPSDMIEFVLPVERASSNRGVNDIQAWGATITYYRRYLYMLALDLTAPDEIDRNNTLKDSVVKISGDTKPARVAPPTPAQRKDIVKEMTKASGDATPELLESLKEAIIALKQKTGTEHNQLIASIGTETNGFKNSTEDRVNELHKQVTELLVKDK